MQDNQCEDICYNGFSFQLPIVERGEKIPERQELIVAFTKLCDVLQFGFYSPELAAKFSQKCTVCGMGVPQINSLCSLISFFLFLNQL